MRALGDHPLILGAGPAGCAAAVELARAGHRPLLVDRNEDVGDPLCGGFMSWRTLAQLDALGIATDDLGGQQVDHLRIFAHGREVSAPLPQPALGLSRRALDTRMRQAALAKGARLEIDCVNGLSKGVAHGQRQDWSASTMFLATGKHDIRGESRPRRDSDPALGLRLRLPASRQRTSLIGSAIELHLFRGGYAGIVLQEGGSANICLALRKSALAECGGTPAALLERLAEGSSALAARLGTDWQAHRIESIGAVPYGWIARETAPGVYRLGDQAAVIPSLAGEGMSIAIASGSMAARHWIAGGAAAAPAFQRAFAAQAHPPVQLARAARKLAESPIGAAAALALARLLPGVVIDLAERCRIQPGIFRATCAHVRPC
ncbi:NAD(P)/FAD-dependent oxidoreductase [Aurantiacibacter hainanensis]|uniref:NAD(P)/FAD-dependent oxidoreductase n=1 Tax=Aurantiacibacter hainanensis TaxID=3076114 RepID=UPI0030C6B9C6